MKKGWVFKGFHISFWDGNYVFEVEAYGKLASFVWDGYQLSLDSVVLIPPKRRNVFRELLKGLRARLNP